MAILSSSKKASQIYQHGCINMIAPTKKYLLFQDTMWLTSLVKEGGICSKDLRSAATCQDLIRWSEYYTDRPLWNWPPSITSTVHCLPLADSPGMTG